MAYEPLHHKYRPQTFGDLVGQETIALTLSNALEQERIAPAYLFTGPRGTGKTSSARILAKSLNCLNSSKPTPNPCGKCEACLAIAKGSALDVMEIDAASNTGVDNIREIIERSRFAPVQCRYKIYAIDECLTGDSLIETSEGLRRIDNPDLKGKIVLSYNENTQSWEYKKVLRWLERGTKETLIIKTSKHQIRCTENHLIRTKKGWIEAKNVQEGMKILSPVNVDVELESINTAQMDEYANLQQDTNLKEIDTEQNLTTLAQFSNKQKQYSPYVNADVKRNLIFPPFSKKKEEESKVSNPTGKDIPTKKVTESGIFGVKTSLILPSHCKRINWDSSMEHCWEMEASTIQTLTVDFLDYVGLTENNSKNGWSTKQATYNNYVHKCKALIIEGMAKNQSFAEQLVILSYKRFMRLLSPKVVANQFLGNGLNLLHQKDLHGGTWMMALSNLVHKAALQSFFTLRDFLNKKIKLFLTGLQSWDILLIQNPTPENLHKKLTTTSKWEQNLVENGYQIYKNTQFPQWTTNLEKVESVCRVGHEKVYDLEVEDNHNFVANGLLVHNCHMLSTAAFNALLKTLEEPPPQVVFILATTDPQRVLSTIISRCQRFDYRRIPLEEMTAHLKYIADAEKIAIADDALTLIAQIANGGLRDAESLLDQLSLLPETITVEKVWDLVGAVPEQDLLRLLEAINQNDSLRVLQQCRSLLDRGREPLIVLQNLASFYLNLLIAKSSPQHSELTAVTETCWQQLCTEAANWQTAVILRGQQHLKEAETQLKRTTQPRLWLEVTLLGLLPEAYTAIADAPTASTASTASTSMVVNPTIPVTVTKSAANAAPTPAVSQPDRVVQESQADQQNSIRVSSAPQQPGQPVTTFSPPNAVEDEPKQVEVARVVDDTPVKAVPLAVAPNPHQDPVANQEIWNKVVSCLQPPTTQALLKQQCYLVSFDGTSAIVGISSAKLQKLNQGKVPNIEAAFAQVCQRLVRVQLEVANLKDSSAKNPITSTNQSAVKAPPSFPQQSFSQPSPSKVQTLQPEPESIQPQNAFGQDPPFAKPAPAHSVPTTINRSSDRANQSQPPNISQDLTVLTAPTIPTENDVAAPTAEPGLNQDHADNDLQQAIDNLTQSFEGELVELHNGDQAKFFEAELTDHEIDSVNLERPDIDDYDDDW